MKLLQPMVTRAVLKRNLNSLVTRSPTPTQTGPAHRHRPPPPELLWVWPEQWSLSCYSPWLMSQAQLYEGMNTLLEPPEWGTRFTYVGSHSHEEKWFIFKVRNAVCVCHAHPHPQRRQCKCQAVHLDCVKELINTFTAWAFCERNWRQCVCVWWEWGGGERKEAVALAVATGERVISFPAWRPTPKGVAERRWEHTGFP